MSALPVVRRPWPASWAWAASLLLGASGCLFGPDDPLDGERKRLLEARTLWRAQGLMDYRYTFRRSCFCAPPATDPVIVTVRGNAVVFVARVDDGAPVDPASYDSIEGLFRLLEEAIDQEAHQVRAEYDAELGFPKTAFIDRDAMIADEELGFEASGVQPNRP